MTNAKHTATPWRTHIAPDGEVSIFASRGICTMGGYYNDEGNAAHIVRCVNAMPDLVAALESLCDTVEIMCMGSQDLPPTLNARAALARAKQA